MREDRAGSRQRQVPRALPLSVREREVMTLVVQGHTSKKIARLLRISDLTVRKHRENLLRKLGMHSTAQLVAFAQRTARDGNKG